MNYHMKMFLTKYGGEAQHSALLDEDTTGSIAYKISQTPHATGNTLRKIYDSDRNVDSLRNIALHPNTPKDVIDHIVKRNPNTAVVSPHLTTQHIDDILDNPKMPQRTLENLSTNPNLTTGHIHKLLNGGDMQNTITFNLSRHPNLKAEHHSKFKTDFAKRSILKHPSISDKMLNDAVHSKDENETYEVAQNPRLNDDQINHLSNHSKYHVRYALASNPSLKPHHIDKLFSDEDADVREQVAKHPNTSIEQLKAHEDDQSADVRHTIRKRLFAANFR